MSGNLKGLLVFLALGALLSGAYGLSLLKGSPLTDSGALTASQLSALEAAQHDTDGDGLTDQEETYWSSDYRNADTDGDGYKDGEEVVSGHNPAIKGPNDALNPKANLTEQTSRIVLGALTTGDLKTGSQNYQQALDAIVSHIFQQYQSNATTSTDRIVTGKNTPDAIISYGLAMSRTLKQTLVEAATGYGRLADAVKTKSLNDLPTLAKTDPQRWTLFLSAINTEIAALDTRVAAIQAIPAPASLTQAHRNAISYFRNVQQQYRALHNINTDPLQGTIAYQVLASLITDTSLKLSADFGGRLSKALQP